MVTIEKITAELGWGLHDACLQRLELDWVAAELGLLIRIKMDERQKVDRLARITVTGVEYCVVDPPIYGDAVQKTLGVGLWIDDGPGVPTNPRVTLPAAPDDCFTHWLFVQEWNSFIHICGRDAKREWLESDSQPVARSSNLKWPGDEIPDP